MEWSGVEGTRGRGGEELRGRKEVGEGSGKSEEYRPRRYQLILTCSSFSEYGGSGNESSSTFLLTIGENSSNTNSFSSFRDSKRKP